jgi:hypothetical protein
VSKSESYWQEALDDAWECGRNFEDEAITQWLESGEVSGDLNNDYPHGDAYHHETHVDKAYNLTEAAQLLDELSEYEESDNGLWDGQDPRDAISTQAAFTYGNAVYDLWRRHVVEELNGHLGSIEDSIHEDASEADKKRAAVAVVKLFLWLGEEYAEGEEGALQSAAFDSAKSYEMTPALVLADWYDEHDQAGKAAALRRIVDEAKKYDVGEEAEEDSDTESESGVTP